ncbi:MULTISPECIES: hypothetical protein [Sphingobium]|uniref:Methyltransferase type 11 domain-containing protein n=1 Tax=Sphingobium tyrosinilyticum TaxID=2715436 RepID=A0ABV9F310_9SPHN|nr:hypothetical protein [Sphingobium sp. EP60837]
MIAFAADSLNGNVADDDIDFAVTGMNHVRFEQAALAFIRALMLNSGILIVSHS